MKKLISIGVALALLTMVVVPGAVAAYEEPVSYAKVPFAIIQSGLELVGDIIGKLPPEMAIPTWIADITDTMAPWAGGPLSWTVDMVAWGVDLLGEILVVLEPLLGLPAELDLVGLMQTVACGLMTPWVSNYTGGVFDPCA